MNQASNQTASGSTTRGRKPDKELTKDDRNLISQRLLRARIRLALQQPFLATALMRLPVREVYGASWCKTAATDGYHIFYNPHWVSKLRDSELRGLLAHEILHVLFTHADRRLDRHPFLWNVACDYAINFLLVQRGFRLPKGGLFSDQVQGKTSEQIYAQIERLSGFGNGKGSKSDGTQRVPRFPGQRPNLGGSRAPDIDDVDSDEVPEVGDDLIDADDPRVRPVRSADAPDRQKLEELRRELREDALARLKGDGAGQFQQEVNAPDSARIDWRALLRSWLSDRIKGDWTTFPFSKRMIHRGLFMPSSGMEVPGHVVFAIDTSGSMALEILHQVVSELRAFREVFPTRLTVLQCDAAIQSVHEFEAMDGYVVPKNFRINGRGGTDFRPVFEWVNANAAGAIVIYATDGEGVFPKKPIDSPVIWIHTPPHRGDAAFPFGSVVRVAVSE